MTKRAVKAVVGVALVACATAVNSGPALGRELSGNKSELALSEQKFSVGPDTVICASVLVSQDLWPVPFDQEWRYGLSNYLVKLLKKRFAETGRVGDPNRFQPDPDGKNNLCNVKDKIFISLEYYRDENGIAFKVDRKISYRSKFNKYSKLYDVEKEISNGSIIRIDGKDDNQSAIVRDVDIQLKEILILIG